MMKRRFLSGLILLLTALSLSAQPDGPEPPETGFHPTLTDLLSELKASYASALASDSLLMKSSPQRARLAELVKTADDVTIMIYTQRPEFSFDIAFALENVSRLLGRFHEQRALSDQYLSASRSGLRRYVLLEESLRDMYRTSVADSAGLSQADSLLRESPSFVPPETENPEKDPLLDSCLRYTKLLTDLYGESVMMARQDSVRYADSERRLSQARDYAQASYAESQKNRFIGGNVNAVQILQNWDTLIRYVKDDLRVRYCSEPRDLGGKLNPYSWSGSYVLNYAVLSLVTLALSWLLAALIAFLSGKYLAGKGSLRERRPLLTAIFAIILFAVSMSLVKTDRDNPYWQMAYQLLSRFAWLTLAIFVSLLIRVRGNQAKPSRNLYLPTLLLAFLSILMRAIFLPASLVPLILPPFLVLFIVWQAAVNIRYRRQVSRVDLRYMWVSLGVMVVVCILSLLGYSMIGVLVLTFWTFLLALLHTITTLYYLMMRYYDDRVMRRKARFHTENPNLPLDSENAFIEVTWLYDLLRMVVVPVAAIYSFQASIVLTARAYQLTLVGEKLLKESFFERLPYLTISNILLVVSLFFVFRYLIYLVKGVFRVSSLRRLSEKRGVKSGPLKESDVNLSLPNTLFSLAGWLLYLMAGFYILHIPTTAVVAVVTGLSAGVGFALKDLINNFFYGIQLMAGRIRVGDKISCDGIRGTVKRVSYQTTQVEEEDGSVIAFTNTELFSKKFKNLSAGKNYELLKIPLSVSYGTDIEFTRKVILEAMEPLMVKNKEGRDLVDPDFPIDVRFDSYGDSSVNLNVVLYTAVEVHWTFPARAKERIYKAFYENGIQIPFPQRDVYIKTLPEK